MLSIQNTAERALAIVDIPPPPPPGPGEVQVRVGAVALNHIDVWGWRGMAFAKRKLPLIVGAEAGGHVVAVGPGVTTLQEGQLVALYGAETCGVCEACREGRDNFCEVTDKIYGFHQDGFFRERINLPARLCVPAPAGLDLMAAATTGITFGTTEHMLFRNAKLKAGETVLVHAGGSGIGTAAIQLAKSVGATVFTTVSSAEKAEKARALGADEVINYKDERFEMRVRKLTGRKGVDVVFEHTGADTWAGSLLAMKRGGRLVTCGATSGYAGQTNLMMLFQQQLRIMGSFGCWLDDMRNVMDRLAAGHARPVIDTMITAQEFGVGLERLESRQVFGKIIVTL